ncbi:Protein LOW PSII ACCUMULATION 1 [Hibiscus syriacus]|uniref:Protein LOW PSII ACCUMULATION 1 n=1 Tax=Hibiscus syriacus TaxID=106335 RepID=A0A6A3A8X8_HIBSY|nr:Protein LOW PSII ACCUMULATION 1 [Hibiscus syriacus]
MVSPKIIPFEFSKESSYLHSFLLFLSNFESPRGRCPDCRVLCQPGAVPLLQMTREAKKAADCLRTALRDYNLKFGTILNDPDLASLIASPEFKELQAEARLCGEYIGYSFRRDLKLISEVQAPFRGIRRFFYVAFSAVAGISLFFTVPRLIRAIKGGDGAPDVWETIGNASINIGCKLRDDYLQVSLFLWHYFSGTTRRRSNLNKYPEMKLSLGCLYAFQLIGLLNLCNYETLRGVLLVPVIWGEGRAPQVEKKGFGVSTKAAAAALPSIGDDFQKRAQSITAKSKLKAQIRFRAEVVSPEEWERWIRDQQEAEGVTPGEDVYIILHLDSRV